MNMQKIRSAPLAFKILMSVCFIIAGFMIFSFIRQLQFPTDIVEHLVRIFLWIGVCMGFYKHKIWAWAAFSVLLIFSVMSIIHAMLSLRITFNLYPFISIFMAIVLLWLLNQPSTRTLFHADLPEQRSVAQTNFSIFCLALALLIIFEILGASRMAGSSTPAKLFLYFLGGGFILLGIGVWRSNRYALEATQSVLIFTTISICIILVYDYFEKNRFMAIGRSIYYILTSFGLLLYWIKSVRPQIGNDEFP